MDLVKCLVIRLNNMMIDKRKEKQNEKMVSKNKYVIMILLGAFGVGLSADLNIATTGVLGITLLLSGIILGLVRTVIGDEK